MIAFNDGYADDQHNDVGNGESEVAKPMPFHEEPHEERHQKLKLEIQSNVVGPRHASSFIVRGEQIGEKEEVQVEIRSAVLHNSGIVREPERTIGEEGDNPLPPPEDRNIERPDTEGAMEPGPNKERHSSGRFESSSAKNISGEEATHQ